ncbi:PrgI family protein [Amycolatopsis roodepoortensis]|uniref:PrgI family protein n=1 Tax=Amycolatopsis roodepoortensis TaxID=700274 RepID=UPI00214C2F77|nr:PrgI family protein [Amycolatopsis roodepoortensis]UUV28605.1 PrgI family protein [Amycolatopsis roodepoortensis]
MTSPVRVPADVDRPDRVLGPLTARQLAILGITGLLLYGLYSLTRGFVPLPVFLIVAIPVGITATVLALGQRDGLPLDRLALAAIRQHLSPRHRVAAPEGVRAAPAWLTAHHSDTRARSRDGRRRSPAGTEPVSPAPLELPAHGVADTGAHAGVVDLGTDGLAVIAVCSTVNFSLRTPGEQEALVASFARYLHSLTAPVQILIRAERLDLAPQIAELRTHAGGLPHPALEAAARDHADYLAELTAQADLLRRQVLLVLREPLRTGPAPAAASSVLPWRHHRRDNGSVENGIRQAAEQRLVRRLDEAVELLIPAGIVATPLDAAAATGVLAAACNPDTFLPPSAALAGADEVVTSTTTFTDLYGPDDPAGDADLAAASHPAPPRPSTVAPRSGRSQAPGPWLSEDEDWDYDDEIESR